MMSTRGAMWWRGVAGHWVLSFGAEAGGIHEEQCHNGQWGSQLGRTQRRGEPLASWNTTNLWPQEMFYMHPHSEWIQDFYHLNFIQSKWSGEANPTETQKSKAFELVQQGSSCPQVVCLHWSQRNWFPLHSACHYCNVCKSPDSLEEFKGPTPVGVVIGCSMYCLARCLKAPQKWK